MVEGQPLRYYYSVFDYPYYNPMEHKDDLVMPQSPNSTQSDSDNSLSSIEVSPKPIRSRTVIQHTPKSNEIRCGWKSCGVSFETLDQLANHVTRVHASSGAGGLFYCGWEGCSRNNKGFNARYKMLVHVRTHTNEKPHQCYQCDKSFSRAENLKIHSRSHSGEKPYVCPVPGCNKAYSNSSDRFKHTRTHQVEKPYKCKVPGCPKRYTDPSSLRKHVKTYKHFVHDTKINDENVKTSIETKPEEKVDGNHSCDCTHMCCVSNLNKNNDIITLGNLINLRRDENYTWNSFYAPERHENVLYSSYQEMDVDTPLDLSVSRKTL